MPSSLPVDCVEPRAAGPQVKLLEGRGFGETRVGPFLEQAVEPPPAAAVQNALRLLEAIGALEERSERLTVRPFGVGPPVTGGSARP